MAFDKLTAVQLAAAPDNGLINESVMQSVMNDNRDIDLELLSMAGNESHSKNFTEWTLDRIPAVDTSLALEDGQDITDNNSTIGLRVGNRTQTIGGRVIVSYEADASDTIGRATELGYQTAKYGIQLERTMQQQMYLNLGSTASADGVAAISAGLEAQITAEDVVPAIITGTPAWTTTKLGTADCVVQQVASAGTITGGGLNNYGATTTGIIDPWVYQAGVFEPGALTEAALRNVCQSIWQNTGRKSTLKGLNAGAVNRLWSEYSFSSTARIATQIADKADGAKDPRAGQGATNIFITDFGVIEFTPENQMPVASTAGTNDSYTLFLMPDGEFKRSSMWGMRGERQGKTGISEKWQVSTAYTSKLLTPGRVGMVQGIDITLAMTA